MGHPALKPAAVMGVNGFGQQLHNPGTVGADYSKYKMLVHVMSFLLS
tara:strand:+ start:253 stop:393 length:141 start_codon:yes stop_codon:yes gene_type:complete